jgi:hypothetical protein
MVEKVVVEDERVEKVVVEDERVEKSVVNTNAYCSLL